MDKWGMTTTFVEAKVYKVGQAGGRIEVYVESNEEYYELILLDF